MYFKKMLLGICRFLMERICADMAYLRTRAHTADITLFRGLSVYRTRIIAALLSATMLVGCTEPNGAPGKGIMNGGALSKSDVGTAVGMIGGGVIGSTIGGGIGQVATTIGGALLGGMLGNAVGTSLDRADREAYDHASQRAMRTGHSEQWKNTDTGHHGAVYPHRRFTNEDGALCRKYTQVIYIDGKKHSAHGTACKQSDGSWKIVE